MLKAPALDGSILLKFPLETKLKSESFKLLVNFLAFLVEKLWPEINKMINYLISGLIINFMNFRS